MTDEQIQQLISDLQAQINEIKLTLHVESVLNKAHGASIDAYSQFVTHLLERVMRLENND